MTHRSKPLLEMSEPELLRTFDQIGLEINRGILTDARKAETQHTIAVVFLELPDGTQRRAHSIEEYGDGEGIRSAQEFVDSSKRMDLLLPGELLYVRVMRVTNWEQVK